MDPDYARRYRALAEGHWWWRSRNRVVVSEVQRLARPGGRLLDVGCGPGALWPRLSAFGDIEGVELDASLVSDEYRDRVHVGPFDEDFVPDHTYDLILFLDVLEHLDDPVGALRHAAGNFEATKKEGGPATDMLRIFIDGEGAASLVAARFPEIFAGAILHRCDGRAGSGPNLRTSGRLSGLPAFAIFEASKKRQAEFAERLQADNPSGMTARSEDVGPLGSAKTIAAWMDKLGTRVPQPPVISYTLHDPSFQRHYWINVLGYDASLKGKPIFDATADRAKNEIRIDLEGITRFELFLSDALVDLSKKVRVVVVEKDKEYEFLNDKAPRDVGRLLEELLATNHPWRIYPAKYVVDLADLRAKTAKLEAEKAKAAQKQAQEKKPDKAAKAK